MATGVTWDSKISAVAGSHASKIEKAFGYDFEGFERNVDVHITSLRRKLEAGGQRFIKTVYGLGYKLEAPAATHA